MARYDSIQLMRGVAALAVMIVHTPIFRTGRFGVDLFFCISGFIMMHVTEQNVRGFLLKRAIRVVPLYWATTLALAAALYFLPGLSRQLEFRVDLVVKSLLFIPLSFVSKNGTTIPALQEVGWTLILEVFFYLVFSCRSQ